MQKQIKLLIVTKGELLNVDNIKLDVTDLGLKITWPERAADRIIGRGMVEVALGSRAQCGLSSAVCS